MSTDFSTSKESVVVHFRGGDLLATDPGKDRNLFPVLFAAIPYDLPQRILCRKLLLSSCILDNDFDQGLVTSSFCQIDPAIFHRI